METRAIEELSNLLNERQRSREHILSGALWSIVGVFTFATPWLVLRERTPVAIAAVYVVAYLALLVAASVRSLSFVLRLGVLMVCLHTATVVAIAQRGYAPNAFLAMGFMVVLATLVLGRRTGFATLAATACSTLGLSIAQHYGLIQRSADWQTYFDSANFSVMTRVTVIFVFVGLTFVLGISHLVESSEELALQTARAFVALADEQSERARISASLQEREAALEALNQTLEARVEERTSLLREAHELLSAEMQARLLVEVELRQAQKLESIGRLAAGIAHEINTPLQYVSDSVQFAREGAGDLVTLVGHYRSALSAFGEDAAASAVLSEVSRQEQDLDLEYLVENLAPALDRALQGLERAATIVRSMKEFAHPGQQAKCEVDLNQAIATTLTIASCEYKHVAEVCTEFGQLPPVACYPGELNQVVLNLVVNAAHAIADHGASDSNKGRIVVRTQLDEAHAIISIADNGGGIPEAIRDRIFEPFFTTKEVGRGTGQGLAIARTVVHDKHGGELTFQTEVGRGTTFFLRLPISGAA